MCRSLRARRRSCESNRAGRLPVNPAILSPGIAPHGGRRPRHAPGGGSSPASAACRMKRIAKESGVLRRLSGWGRFPKQLCRVYRPESRAELFADLRETVRRKSTCIPRGAGRSYGDAALNPEGVVLYERLNRFRSFDPATATLECEAGTTLAEILEHLLPRGFIPPVLPGTKFVTVGGSIAADIHGKNHHRDGSFCRWVTRMEIALADGRTVACSPDSNQDLYRATLGGMGLTGVILSASIRLRRVESAWLWVERERIRGLDAILERMLSGDRDHLYSVAWLDPLGGDRGVLMRGDHAPARSLPAGAEPFARRTSGAPLPARWLSPFLRDGTMRVFNEAYFRRSPRRARQLVGLDSFFFPLDAVRDWPLAYGRRGFLQYQVVFPTAEARGGLRELLDRVRRSPYRPYLSVLKQFGEEGAGLLSFPLGGFTLALDFPLQPGLVAFLQELDRLVARRGGRVYLAKDAVLRAELFPEMYPRAGRFCEIQRMVDPHGIFASSLSRRLKITPADR